MASDHLCHYLTKDKFQAIYLITEPYLYKNKVPGLSHLYNVYGTQNSSHAIILAPKLIPLFQNNDLTDKDHTVVLYDDGEQKCYFASVYCDGNMPSSVSNTLVKMCDFFSENHSNAIFGLDSNSHSTLWNSPEIDSRGLLWRFGRMV